MVEEIPDATAKKLVLKLYYLLTDKLGVLGVGRDRLFAILKANHMLIKPKELIMSPTDSHHRFWKHRNLIEGITPTRPEQIWVSDITRRQ